MSAQFLLAWLGPPHLQSSGEVVKFQEVFKVLLLLVRVVEVLVVPVLLAVVG